MNASLLIPLALLVVLSVPTVRALSRSRTTPVTREAVRSYSVAMGRLALALAAAAYMVLSLNDAEPWLIPLVAGCCVALLAVLERRWPRQRGAVRVAALRRRTLWSVVRRSRVVFAAAGWLTLAAAVVAGIAVRSSVPGADGDLIGVAVIAPPADPAPQSSSLSLTLTQPISSLWWVWIATGGLLIVTALAALAVRQVLRRPVLADVDEQTDAALRRMSAERLVRLVGAAAFGLAVLLCSELSSALYLLGVQVKGVVIGMAWLANCGAWIGALAVLVAFYAGPVRLPRMSRDVAGRPADRSR